MKEKKYLFPFEKLEAWQLARDLIMHIYNTSKNFPASEQYGLIGQINRAAISVASNLAEGSSRMSPKDQAHFSQLAYGSLMEVVCQLNIAMDLGFLEKEEHSKFRQRIMVLSSKINALRHSQRERTKGVEGLKSG
jgi:four helix bundle protein